MLDFIKKNIFICVIFIVTLSVGFLTFLTFINKSFLELNQTTLQSLLISNVVLLLVFFLDVKLWLIVFLHGLFTCQDNQLIINFRLLGAPGRPGGWPGCP